MGLVKYPIRHCNESFKLLCSFSESLYLSSHTYSIINSFMLLYKDFSVS